MAVRGIDDDDIDAGFDQGGDALVIIRTDADGSADQQTALGVLAGQRGVRWSCGCP
jgi:hypothetical protein